MKNNCPNTYWCHCIKHILIAPLTKAPEVQERAGTCAKSADRTPTK